MNLLCTVTSGYTNDKTGKFSPMSEQKNLVLYEGSDIIASLLAGDTESKLSHMYFHYQNTNSPTPTITVPTLDRTMGRSWFSAIAGGAAGYEDWLRVPIITEPRLFKSPSNTSLYQSNGLYVTATSAASATMAGESPAHNYFGASGSPDHGPSLVVGAALVAARASDLSSQDRVFSRVNLATPIPFIAGSQITIFWSVKIS